MEIVENSGSQVGHFFSPNNTTYSGIQLGFIANSNAVEFRQVGGIQVDSAADAGAKKAEKAPEKAAEKPAAKK